MNTLYYGDNLKVLKEHIRDESVDLIYLDPPFNSNRSYNVLFKDEGGASSDAQITAFDDSWHWGPQAQETYDELRLSGPHYVGKMIEALHYFIARGKPEQGNQMMAYLVMMAARLVELHRVLKPTGALYLHCDPTASHYLKILLDTIFGPENFVNEIVWERSSTRSSISKSLRRAHDVILFYTKSDLYTFNMQFKELAGSSLQLYENEDENGNYQLVPLLVSGVRNGETGKIWHGIDPNKHGKAGMHWVTTPAKLTEYEEKGLVFWPEREGGTPRLKYYLHQSPGVPLNDVWYDVQLIPSGSKESLGYPTQKPLALLERIISTSSNPGDIVLDPFSGCGTCIAASQKLGRQWIGIDITHLAIAMHKNRLKSFGLLPKIDYRIIGEPEDLPGARQLAIEDRFQFEAWAISLMNAQPINRPTHTEPGKRDIHKGSDKGIDGVKKFLDGRKGELKRALIQVKSGHVKSGDIRDLIGTLDRERAEIGVFITLENPSRDMLTEALTAGSYHSEIWERDYPRIQILTIEQLLNGEEPKLPQTPPKAGPYKEAERVKKATATQDELDLDGSL